MIDVKFLNSVSQKEKHTLPVALDAQTHSQIEVLVVIPIVKRIMKFTSLPRNPKREHHLLPRSGRRRASTQEQPSSWLHLVS